MYSGSCTVPMPAAPSAQRICPHCGAKVDAIWTSCWMCGLDLPALEISGELQAPPQPVEPSFVTRAAAIVPWLLAGLIGLMLIGLCADGNWGAALGFLLFLTPAGIYTFAKSLQRQGAGNPMSGAAKFGTFILSLAITIGCVFAVGVAAFIALFVICIASLSNANWH